MRKIILTIFLLASVPFFLKADPPKKVTVTYDSKTSVVKVEVFHPVADVKKHYVEKIVIKVDEVEVKTFTETKQSDNKTETVELVLQGIKPGSKIEAVAYCSLFGSKKGKLTVE